MVHLIVQASKYIMILLFMIYTYECFHVFRFNDGKIIYTMCKEYYFLRFILMRFWFYI